ncbi:hypothetical protein NQ314_018550 [Rhamnusium bicolor]|uniref:DDE-1 domain-containing protein n=1 Tax=Rhamnusium bicolor TaxID=1586634 RepID=A0AAV8WRC3_9CUCU|nr:hypothetical protein NQ314_018550 [Rhamnusium bicolor]
MNGQNKGSPLVKSFGRTPVFTKAMEKELESHILKFEERMFGLTIKDQEKKWFYKFMKRNPRLSLRQPEATSLARMKGFSKGKVGEFFNVLERLVDKHELNGTRMYNMDESGFTTVQKKSQKVLGLKGKHQVGAASSGERGVNTTVVKRYAPEMERGAPTGSEIVISDTGYITSELFIQWLRHFKDNVICSKENPVLLLLDGHATHSKNLEALFFARDNEIIMLQLPSHTTHRMQPLDVAFFRPLGLYYIQAQETFLRQHIGKPVTQYDVVTLLAEAYGRAATVGTAENAFIAAGIWPVNRHVFRDHDFAPSDALRQTSDVNTISVPPSPGSFSESLNKASPVPQITAGPSNQRKQQNAEVITSTPYKENLEMQKSKANKKLLAKSRRAVFVDATTISNSKKKKMVSGSSSGGEDFVSSEDFVGTDDFNDFNRNELQANDYVLIVQKKSTAGFIEISIMRKSTKIKNAFVFPAVPHVSEVDDCDIKMKLRNPQKHGQTKRQQSYISFGIEFNMNVR